MFEMVIAFLFFTLQDTKSIRRNNSRADKAKAVVSSNDAVGALYKLGGDCSL